MKSLHQWQGDQLKLLREVEGLLSLIPQPILVVDSEGTVIHTNSYSEKIWGCSQITIMNKSFLELIESVSLLEHVKLGRPLSDFPVKLIHMSGKLLPFTCRLHPILVNKGIEGAILQFTKQETLREAGPAHRYTTRFSFHDIIGNCEVISGLKERAEQVAKSESTILIRGESGTGKEVFAQAIHGTSSRKAGPFIAINCAAIPEALLESELFGYEEGAFTGAKKGGKQGRFELARGGTLFLDEIGDMPLYLQAKLLRVLQERRMERVGGQESISVDVRIIAATHKNLEDMIAKRQFREDLYYRLNVIPLYIPPLRERKEDLYELIHYYMKKFCGHFDKEPKRFSSQAMQRLYQYDWPGNVRELQNVVEYIVNLEIGEIVTINSLPVAIQNSMEPAEIENGGSLDREYRVSVRFREEKEEEERILEALERYGRTTEGKKKVAEALGISMATLYRRLQRMK